MNLLRRPHSSNTPVDPTQANAHGCIRWRVHELKVFAIAAKIQHLDHMFQPEDTRSTRVVNIRLLVLLSSKIFRIVRIEHTSNAYIHT